MRVMELHSPLRIVQRSKGRTATAAAAYRSGERIACERTGDVHDYTRKRGIEGTAMLLPYEAPDWAHDRSKLWNAAEKREKHPKAQTAREVEIAFPAEFSAKQRREAGLAIASFLVERHGVAVDIAWHKPGKKSDERNHHVHMMFTTRQFENGEWSKTKARTLDDLYGGKGKEEVNVLRRSVADVMNDIAARDRLDVYVEHQSFKTRGVDREATQHMGPIANEMERKGKRTDIGDKNRNIEQRNAQRENLKEQKKNLSANAAQQDGRIPALPDYDVAMSRFYRSSQDLRRDMLERLQNDYGQQEKNAQVEIARRTLAIDKAGFFSRFYRNVTGKTKADLAAISQHEKMLDMISEKRRTAADDFERRRLQGLERLKQSQSQQEIAYEKSLHQLTPEKQQAVTQQRVAQEPQREIKTETQEHTITPSFNHASEEVEETVYAYEDDSLDMLKLMQDYEAEQKAAQEKSLSDWQSLELARTGEYAQPHTRETAQEQPEEKQMSERDRIREYIREQMSQDHDQGRSM